MNPLKSYQGSNLSEWDEGWFPRQRKSKKRSQVMKHPLYHTDPQKTTLRWEQTDSFGWRHDTQSVFWHQPSATAFCLASCQAPVMTHRHVSSSTATSAGLISAFKPRFALIERRHVYKARQEGISSDLERCLRICFLINPAMTGISLITYPRTGGRFWKLYIVGFLRSTGGFSSE